MSKRERVKVVGHKTVTVMMLVAIMLSGVVYTIPTPIRLLIAIASLVLSYFYIRED